MEIQARLVAIITFKNIGKKSPLASSIILAYLVNYTIFLLGSD